MKVNRTTKQILSLTGTHLFTNITLAVVGLVFLTAVLTNPTGKIIWGIVAAIVYAMMIYSKSWQIAQEDNKHQNESEGTLLKGFLLPVGTLLVSLILLSGYLFAWRFLVIDGELASATAYIYNVMYVLATFAFNSFLGLINGGANIYGHIFMYLLPFIASVLGYVAGAKGISISEKLIPMIYEKKK